MCTQHESTSCSPVHPHCMPTSRIVLFVKWVVAGPEGVKREHGDEDTMKDQATTKKHMHVHDKYMTKRPKRGGKYIFDCGGSREWDMMELNAAGYCYGRPS